MTSISNFINPIVKRCEDDVNLFIGEVGAIRKIISRFDEVLLEKASKFSVDKVVHEAKLNYLTIAQFKEHQKEKYGKESEVSSEINLIRNLIDSGHDELYQRL